MAALIFPFGEVTVHCSGVAAGNEKHMAAIKTNAPGQVFKVFIFMNKTLAELKAGEKTFGCRSRIRIGREMY